MTEIHLHNTLTGKKEKFTPINNGEVSIYSCGPTVYDYAHIGNFRTFVFGDILRRMFAYNGYTVNQVMNITDVDDKTIKKSQQEKISLSAVTRKYEDLFLQDLQSLNILRASKTPRATESIALMVDLIEKLLEKGIAYQTSDGIYFDISKSEDYGALAHLNKQTINKERVASDEYDKENAKDFALWKLHSPEDGEVFFDAPFGRGRPGWHIECSAMSMENLGETFDIHTGGVDLIFPHHTNEIAQSQAATGKKFVNYWVHGEFITVEGEKMSKSLGNIFTLSDLKARKIHPLAFRYWLLTSHYRTPANFTWESLSGAQTAYLKLKQTTTNLKTEVSKGIFDIEREIFDKNKKEFLECINDDLNIAKAIGLIWQILKEKEMNEKTKLELILDFDKVLGLKLSENFQGQSLEENDVPEHVLEMKKEHDEARASKNFQKSDELRQEIEREGYSLEDKNGESLIRKHLNQNL